MSRRGSDPLKPGEVSVNNLWESFRIFHSRPRGLKERVLRFQKSVHEDFWALRGVNFHLEPGESLAVIGSNGSGKSTLLKCLTRILAPDRGHVAVGGKVATLLELGAGFHGDLSGRDNIFLNGSILGMRKKELEKAYDAIVDYAGVGEFIDNPVRNYSSGMYVRLGFAVAVNVDPDVLLIDEILAVGDASFQEKCYEKMYEFKRAGKTLVLVTHDVNAAASLCDRAILLESGSLVAEGTTREVGAAYLQRLLTDQTGATSHQPPDKPAKRWGLGGARVLSVEILDDGGHSVDAVALGDQIVLRQRVEFMKEVEDPVFAYILRADNGTELATSTSLRRHIKTGRYKPGDVVEVRFAQTMNLLPGRYVFTVMVANRDGSRWLDWWDDCLPFHVLGIAGDKGFVHLESSMELEAVEPASLSEPRHPGD